MRRITRLWLCGGLAVLVPLFARAGDAPPAARSAGEAIERQQASTRPVVVDGPYFLHLPGIGGYLPADRWLVRGLHAGGVGEVEIYDWTEHDPGLHALLARARNMTEARLVADKIAAHAKAFPNQPIALTGHSGGAAVAIWALELLPPDVQIDQLVLLAPALSPAYDLTAALRHVRGKLSVFSSPHDEIVLGTGTTLLGTMDGQHVEAAGKVGFVRPATADADQYAKLDAHPYEDSWSSLGNWGDHIGPMASPFARELIAPLLLAPADHATTQPVASAAGTGRGEGAGQQTGTR